ncbi:hypothetical protein FBU30_005602 [Linnemannia zychae]|nr:hypothetical protein FBU30_005602 [Linnemannia zychae]
MIRLSPMDGTLELLLARFRKALKPPVDDFTKQLPHDVELNTHLIDFVIRLLEEFGLKYSEDTSYLRAHHAIAIDFISKIKVERPDVIDLFLQKLPPLPPSVFPPETLSDEDDVQTNSHYYIPRFILETFADNFTLDDREYIMKSSNPARPEFNPRKPNKLRYTVRPNYGINIYNLEDQSLGVIDVPRGYGVEDMYKDITDDDGTMVEELLSKLESTCALFIRQIWNEEKIKSLTRSQDADLKKFLVSMMYRSEHWRGLSSKSIHAYDMPYPITEHMFRNRIKNFQNTWFRSLKWLVETSVEDILKEYRKLSMIFLPEIYMKPSAQYQGPIVMDDLAHFGYLMSQTFVCVWKAEEGSEFILSNSCFGCFDGEYSGHFHNFFVVSPQYAIILVSPEQTDEYRMNPRSQTLSFGDQFNAPPEVKFKKGSPPRDFIPSTFFTPHDVFNYKTVVIPKNEVYNINCIFMDSQNRRLTYKSSVSMYKSLLYYNKTIALSFQRRHDYSTLKKRLLSELNRIHL